MLSLIKRDPDINSQNEEEKTLSRLKITFLIDFVVFSNNPSINLNVGIPLEVPNQLLKFGELEDEGHNRRF